MTEFNPVDTLTNTDSNLKLIPLSEQTNFRLIEINKIKDYFNFEIGERKAMSQKLSTYIGAFNYIDKTLIALLQQVEE